MEQRISRDEVLGFSSARMGPDRPKGERGQREEGRFDIEHLHDLMRAIPERRWTTYGDLGQQVAVHPKALGSHIKACVDCPYAWRVLRAGGLPHGGGFRWSDPTDRRDPNGVLADEGVRVIDGRFDVAQFISGADLAAEGTSFDWPTIEWLRDRANLKTGGTHGAPRRRHFSHCEHFYAEGQAGVPLDQPAYRATDQQMRELPICKDCVRAARTAGHPAVGPREPLTEVADLVVPEPDAAAPTDYATIIRSRAEQSALRRELVGGRSSAACDLCGRTFPVGLLVAAHIVPRARLSDAQRRDYRRAAMLACALGCDAVFELGHVVVNKDGVIEPGRLPAGEALASFVDTLTGRFCTAHDTSRADRFAEHRSLHI